MEEPNLGFVLYGLSEDLPAKRELLMSDFNMTFGSSSTITAHNMAVLDSRVMFLSRTGQDPLGEICCQPSAEATVNITGVVRKTKGKPTGASFLLLLPNSTSRRILTYAWAMLEMSKDDIDQKHAATAQHLHLCAFFLHRKLMPYILELFARMKARKS